jgi:hypothetical protein
MLSDGRRRSRSSIKKSIIRSVKRSLKRSLKKSLKKSLRRHSRRKHRVSKSEIGTKLQVYNGTKLMTVGGLMKKDLVMNKKRQRVVSKKQRAHGKKMWKRFMDDPIMRSKILAAQEKIIERSKSRSKN